MNTSTSTLTIKALLLFTFVATPIIIWHSIPAMEKQSENQEFSILNSDGKPSPILQKLLQRFNFPTEPTAAIVDATQKGWLRTAGKERWETEDPYADRKNELMPLFKEVGVLDEIRPTEKEYDYVIVLGALQARIKTRLEHTVKLWNEGYRFKEIVLLGSERKLDPTQEQAGTGTTEYEMMQWIYHHLEIPSDMKTAKTTFINTPNTIDAKGTVKRATTADTIRQWLATSPRPGTCLIISNQPYVTYQGAVVKTYLPESFKVFLAGQTSSADMRVCEVLDTLARWIYQENELLKKRKLA